MAGWVRSLPVVEEPAGRSPSSQSWPLCQVVVIMGRQRLSVCVFLVSKRNCVPVFSYCIPPVVGLYAPPMGDGSYGLEVESRGEILGGYCWVIFQAGSGY